MPAQIAFGYVNSKLYFQCATALALASRFDLQTKVFSHGPDYLLSSCFLVNFLDRLRPLAGSPAGSAAIR
jgi:hypothetical protein